MAAKHPQMAGGASAKMATKTSKTTTTPTTTPIHRPFFGERQAPASVMAAKERRTAISAGVGVNLASVSGYLIGVDLMGYACRGSWLYVSRL